MKPKQKDRCFAVGAGPAKATEALCPDTVRDLVCTFLIVVSIAGCNPAMASRRDEAFARQYPAEDVDHSLVLRSVEGITETRVGEVITLQVENHSSQMIAFAARAGVVGATYDPTSESWVEVENTVEYPDIQWLLGPPGGEVPSTWLIDYNPGLALPDPAQIRVIVLGHVYDAASQTFGEAVVAYIDLDLEQ